MTTATGLAVAALLTGAIPALASEPMPEGLNCALRANSAIRMDGGESWFMALPDDSLTVVFSAIDPASGAATYAGNLGAGMVAMRADAGELIFTEAFAGGSVITTSVRAVRTPPYPAAQSRHIVLGNELRVVEYSGTCVPVR